MDSYYGQRTDHEATPRDLIRKINDFHFTLDIAEEVLLINSDISVKDLLGLKDIFGSLYKNETLEELYLEAAKGLDERPMGEVKNIVKLAPLIKGMKENEDVRPVEAYLGCVSLLIRQLKASIFGVLNYVLLGRPRCTPRCCLDALDA